MGEAKRRKQLDPKFGKSHKLTKGELMDCRHGLDGDDEAVMRMVKLVVKVHDKGPQ